MSQDLFFRLFGNIVGGLLFLAIGYVVARRMKRRRADGALPMGPIAVGAICSLVSISAALGRTWTAATGPIDPMVVRQPTNALTNADITPEYAEEIKGYLVKNMRANMPAGSGDVTGTTAGVVAVNGRRFAVVRMAVNGEENIVTILGIKGDQIVRVTCGVKSGHVDYRSPECASAIRNSLNVELP